MGLRSPQNPVSNLHSTPRAVESPRKALSRRVARSRTDFDAGTRVTDSRQTLKPLKGNGPHPEPSFPRSFGAALLGLCPRGRVWLSANTGHPPGWAQSAHICTQLGTKAQSPLETMPSTFTSGKWERHFPSRDRVKFAQLLFVFHRPPQHIFLHCQSWGHRGL